ncbi:MAG: hypothetical protein ABSE20_18730 [Acetobacteraceae bacterium]|jgi:hypothetical protein
MTPRIAFAVLALLSQTGCVAAIPLATQLVSGTNSTAQLCSMAKMPGQTASLCDRFSFGAASQAPLASSDQPAHGTSTSKIVNTAAR